MSKLLRVGGSRESVTGRPISLKNRPSRGRDDEVDRPLFCDIAVRVQEISGWAGWRPASADCGDCCGAQTKGTPALVDSLLGDFVEKTPGVTADGRTTRDALGPTTTNDPEGTTPNGPRTGEPRYARCLQYETGLGLAVSDAHPCCCKDQKPADAWQSGSGQRHQ